MKTRASLVSRFCYLLAAGWCAAAASAPDVVINARVFNGYARTRLPDGSFKPETYGFGEGGRWDGAKVDPSLDGLSFLKIARTIAGPLRAQGFVPSSDPKHTDLLILVYWGATTGAEGGDYDHAMGGVGEALNGIANAPPDSVLEPSLQGTLQSALIFQRMENRMRERNNLRNADILGYTDAYRRAEELRQIGFSAGDSTIWELEADRYFVVLKAFDFPYAVKEKKLRLLWEARYSIYERGNRFDEQLLAMTLASAKFFGRDTSGLVRREVPEGKVELGTPKVVEEPARQEKGAQDHPGSP